MNFGLNLWNKAVCRMHGLVVIEGMTLSGHPWIINQMIMNCNLWQLICHSNYWKNTVKKSNHGRRKLILRIYDSSNFLTFWRQINGNMMIQKFMKSSQYKICRIHLIFFDFSESLTKMITGNRLIRNQRKQFPWNMYYLFN